MVGKTDINNISFVLNGLIYKGMHYSFKIIQTSYLYDHIISKSYVVKNLVQLVYLI